MTLPSPLLALSPGFGFFERTLSSFRGAVTVVSMPSRLIPSRSILSDLTSNISGDASGFTKVVSDNGTRWRLALGCWTEASELSGRWRRLLLRVPFAGPPSCRAGENIVDVAMMLVLWVARRFARRFVELPLAMAQIMALGIER